MDKVRAQHYVDILERFHPIGWCVVHICPGSEYTIGKKSGGDLMSRGDGDIMICSAKFIVGSVLSVLSKDPFRLQAADPRDIRELMTTLDTFVTVGDHSREILV